MYFIVREYYWDNEASTSIKNDSYEDNVKFLDEFEDIEKIKSKYGCSQDCYLLTIKNRRRIKILSLTNKKLKDKYLFLMSLLNNEKLTYNYGENEPNLSSTSGSTGTSGTSGSSGSSGNTVKNRFFGKVLNKVDFHKVNNKMFK